LTVRWDNGRTDRWQYARTSDGITLDGTLFRPARAIPATALLGEWSGAQSTTNAFANTYRFARDGSFWFGSGTTGIAGRYRVQGFALSLVFADGSEERRTLLAAGEREPADAIGVDGDVYVRR
jgi:hypothetical protein